MWPGSVIDSPGFCVGVVLSRRVERARGRSNGTQKKKKKKKDARASRGRGGQEVS